MNKNIIYPEWTKVDFEQPDWVFDRVKKEREIQSWCWTHFPMGNWLVYSNRAFFQNESDATFFRLVWS